MIGLIFWVGFEVWTRTPDAPFFLEDFHRGKFEAARRKLQRQLRDTWMRASRVAEEIHRTSKGLSEVMSSTKGIQHFFLVSVDSK